MWLLSRSVCRGCDQSEQSYCRVTCLYHVTRVVTGFTVTSLIHGLCDLLHFDWLLPWQTESLHGRNAVSWDAVNCNVMSLQWAEIVDMMSEPLAGATAVAVWVCWRPTLIQPMSHDSIWLHQSCLQSDRQSSVSDRQTVICVSCRDCLSAVRVCVSSVLVTSSWLSNVTHAVSWYLTWSVCLCLCPSFLCRNN